MAADMKITGVKLIIEVNDNGEWHDLTEHLDDEAVEALESFIDDLEVELNEAKAEFEASLYEEESPKVH